MLNFTEIKEMRQKFPQFFEIQKNQALVKLFSNPENVKSFYQMMLKSDFFNGVNNNENIENSNDKEKYKNQLDELNNFGFYDTEKNLKVLNECNGDVQSSVERLFDLIG